MDPDRVKRIDMPMTASMDCIERYGKGTTEMVCGLI